MRLGVGDTFMRDGAEWQIVSITPIPSDDNYMAKFTMVVTQRMAECEVVK